jgi:hypothetical protein
VLSLVMESATGDFPRDHLWQAVGQLRALEKKKRISATTVTLQLHMASLNIRVFSVSVKHRRLFAAGRKPPHSAPRWLGLGNDWVQKAPIHMSCKKEKYSKSLFKLTGCCSSESFFFLLVLSFLGPTLSPIPGHLGMQHTLFGRVTVPCFRFFTI